MDSNVQVKYLITLNLTDTELHDLFLEIDEILENVPEGAYGFPDLKKLKESISKSLSHAKDNICL